MDFREIRRGSLIRKEGLSQAHQAASEASQTLTGVERVESRLRDGAVHGSARTSSPV
jgi:hypothetical protein